MESRHKAVDPRPDNLLLLTHQPHLHSSSTIIRQCLPESSTSAYLARSCVHPSVPILPCLVMPSQHWPELGPVATWTHVHAASSPFYAWSHLELASTSELPLAVGEARSLLQSESKAAVHHSWWWWGVHDQRSFT